jgi:hypothetical protein
MGNPAMLLNRKATDLRTVHGNLLITSMLQPILSFISDSQINMDPRSQSRNAFQEN